jgi:hypothetical protein
MANQEMVREQLRDYEHPSPGREYDPAALFLPEDFDFTVLSGRMMDVLWRNSRQHGFIEDAKDEWQLSPTNRLQLAESAGAHGALNGTVASHELETHVMDAYNDQVAASPQNGKRLMSVTVDNIDAVDDLASALVGHDVVNVEMVPAKGRMRITVLVNAEPIAVQHVISYGMDRPDPDKVTSLVPGNVKRLYSEPMIAAWLAGVWANVEALGRPHEATLGNAQVKHWMAVTGSRND